LTIFWDLVGRGKVRKSISRSRYQLQVWWW